MMKEKEAVASHWRFAFWVLVSGVLLTGTLGFFLYTYMSMCFGAAYNRLFLVYVTLFDLSLYAFILSMMSFDLATLPAHFSEKLPRRGIAGMLIFTAAFLRWPGWGGSRPPSPQALFPCWKTQPACSSRRWTWR